MSSKASKRFECIEFIYDRFFCSNGLLIIAFLKCLLSIDNAQIQGMLESPLVSVIVPNYNHAQYLDQRLNSILNQTYRNIEVIVLDDCSTDNSLEIIQKYTSDSRIAHVVANGQNSGNTFLQWNKGLHLAKGELVWIAESDDYCESDLLEKLVAAYSRKTGTVLAFSTSMIVNENGEHRLPSHVSRNRYMRGKSFICRYMAVKNMLWNASSAIFSRETALSVDPVYQTFRAAGDYLFWIELAEKGRVAIVNGQLNYFRRHDGVVTSKSESTGVQFVEVKRVLDYIDSRGYVSRFRKSLTYTYNSIHASGVSFSSGLVKDEVYEIWDVDHHLANKFYVRVYKLVEKLRDKYDIII